ncbi:MAG: tetratricopeptide repeat protein [Verrucomicrobiota bacterium]
MEPYSDGVGESSRTYLLAQLVRSRQWDRAGQLAGELLAEDPESTYLHGIRGQAALVGGDLALAERHLEKALAGDPDDDHTLWLLGKIAFQRNEEKKAEDLVSRAIGLDPQQAHYWQTMGWVAWDRDDFESARDCANRARQLDPTEADHLILLARAEQSLKAPAPLVMGLLDEALALDPENAEVHDTVGNIQLTELKDPAKAETSFRRALTLDPTDDRYRKNLLGALRKTDPFLRILYLPWEGVKKLAGVWDWVWEKKWPLIGFIFVAKYLLVILMAMLVLWLMWMFPVARVYEYLTLSDIRARAGDVRARKGGLLSVHQWPFAARIGAFIAFSLGFFYLLFRASQTEAFGLVLGVLIGIGVVLWVILGIVGLVSASRSKRQAKKRQERLKTIGRDG